MLERYFIVGKTNDSLSKIFQILYFVIKKDCCLGKTLKVSDLLQNKEWLIRYTHSLSFLKKNEKKKCLSDNQTFRKVINVYTD